MSLSRRAFVQTIGVGTAGTLTSMMISRRPETLMELWSGTPLYAAPTSDILIHNNENPVGPGQAVIDAVRAALGQGGSEAGRYPFSRYGNMIDALANKYASVGAKRENILLGNGSTQLLRTLTHVSCSKDKALVGSEPTYEECAGYAAVIGAPVKGTKLTNDLKLDLDATMAAAKGAGMVFFCNPNNPTATAHGASDAEEFIKGIVKSSPGTNILVDEAYFDYATDPSYKTMIPLALEYPQVVVCRTFSKAFGMAGLRMGYAVGRPETIKKMGEWDGMGYINVAAVAGGIAAIERGEDYIAQERTRNTAARDFTRNYFHGKGYTDTESQTNFLFVNVAVPTDKFQKACKDNGVRVGRLFPPLTTWARISIGTMEEMQKAVKVFDTVLGQMKAAA